MTALMLLESYLAQKAKRDWLASEAGRSDAQVRATQIEIHETLKRLDGKVLIHANTDSTTAYWMDGLLNLHSAPCVWSHEIDAEDHGAE